MSIRNISFLSSDEQTLNDILRELGHVAMVCVNENNVEHAYIGDDDIYGIDQDILNKPTKSCFIVHRNCGYGVHVDV